MRSLINIIILIFIAWILPSCIEEFVPDIEAGESSKFVVFGELTTEHEDQVISVSLVSSIRDPQSIPLNDCMVKIVDSHGKTFDGIEFEDGNYNVRIPREHLSVGNAFRLEIETYAGTKLVSEFEGQFNIQIPQQFCALLYDFWVYLIGHLSSGGVFSR